MEINIGGLQLAGASLSQRRAASGVDSTQALLAMRRRTLSFPPPDALAAAATAGAAGGAAGGGVVENVLPSIQDFNLIKVLGKGSFGKVYLVRTSRSLPASWHNSGSGSGLDQQGQGVFAMKVLRKSEVIKRHQVEHTLTERSILATTSHPFILALRFAFQTEHKLYMVTDYCPGGELFFHLKKLRRFTEGEGGRASY